MDYKRLPYGVADYTWIKSQNRYCADKTMFIPKMEKSGDFLYLLQILLFINAAHRRNIKKEGVSLFIGIRGIIGTLTTFLGLLTDFKRKLDLTVVAPPKKLEH